MGGFAFAPGRLAASQGVGQFGDGCAWVSVGLKTEASDIRGTSSSSTRGTSPKTLLSFLEERTRAARSCDERVFEVGGGGNATGG